MHKQRDFCLLSQNFMFLLKKLCSSWDEYISSLSSSSSTITTSLSSSFVVFTYYYHKHRNNHHHHHHKHIYIYINLITTVIYSTTTATATIYTTTGAICIVNINVTAKLLSVQRQPFQLKKKNKKHLQKYILLYVSHAYMYVLHWPILFTKNDWEDNEIKAAFKLQEQIAHIIADPSIGDGRKRTILLKILAMLGRTVL